MKPTVKEMCKVAGIAGKFTNHSLRAICASHMYANDIPEKVINEVTGHKSDCVHMYKQMREKASNTLSKSEVENVEIKKEIAKKLNEGCQCYR